jgi:hypothetical protein
MGPVILQNLIHFSVNKNKCDPYPVIVAIKKIEKCFQDGINDMCRKFPGVTLLIYFGVAPGLLC